MLKETAGRRSDACGTQGRRRSRPRAQSCRAGSGLCETTRPARARATACCRSHADKPPEGAVAGARRQLAGAEAVSGRREDLVSIPGSEEALVDEAPPYKRFNAAYIDIPGPYEKGLPSVYYIAPPDPNWSRGRAARLHSGRDRPARSSRCTRCGPATSCSSCTPTGRRTASGALRQLRLRRRLGTLHRRDDAARPASAVATPKCTIGQLLNALLRNVRFLSAIGLHAEGMSVAASRGAVRGEGVPGLRQREPAGRARHLRPGLSQLHARQADDPQAARRLDGRPRRRAGVESVPRRVPVLRRAADPARAPGDARIGLRQHGAFVAADYVAGCARLIRAKTYSRQPGLRRPALPGLAAARSFACCASLNRSCAAYWSKPVSPRRF